MPPVPTTSALERSRRELSEDVSFGIGTLLVVEQPTLEPPPQGGVLYTVVRGTVCTAVQRKDISDAHGEFGHDVIVTWVVASRYEITHQ